MSATATVVRHARTKSPARLPTFNACWQGIARYFIHRAAIASLREFDDCALADIGLARFQIEAAVHGSMNTPDRPRM